jgi:hypothetical protein
MVTLQRQLEREKATYQSELEKYKATLQAQQNHWIATEARNHHAWISDKEDGRTLMRAVFDFAAITIRSLILINGGATIGILTFLGNLWNKDAAIARLGARAFGYGISGFVVGLCFALLTAGLSYITQALFSELPREGINSPAKKWGNRVRILAIIAAVLSLVGFIFGSWKCMSVFIDPPIYRGTDYDSWS